MRDLLQRFLLAVCLATAGAAGLRAQEATPTEYQVKAFMLVNFANFVEWPDASFARTDDPIVIGILGKDPFGKELDKAVESKLVKNRKFIVKRFTSLEQSANCNILFISSSEHNRLPAVIQQIKGRGVLTVNEDSHFTELGGVINFVIRDKKVRFEINAGAAQQAGLKINSQLLRLAINTRDKFDKD